uniref:Sulfate transport system permease protein CysT n=1 Tax=Caulerpa cliftonii TaxID=1004391 RepID=A0A1C9JBV5_9CHLO|nr:sulfate ABC transporter permease subunit CysT [Caulerpa cliftonii]AOP19323.1 sulfate ABC transporter permease subunit CysT [Caulerpa cliftonii]
MALFISFYFIAFLIFPIVILFSTSLITFGEFFWEKATTPVAICAYQLSLSLSFTACLINTFFGFLVVWVLTRYNFPGQKLLDAIIDLPFCLPTSVAGLSICAIYGSKGWIGQFLLRYNIQIVFTKWGLLLAMIFVSFPFVVRSVQPAFEQIDKQLEEAAWCLGASSWQTFLRIIWPTLVTPLSTGMILSFSRCIGEYGAIVLLSSNFPFKDLVTPVLIFQCLEQYDYTGATIFGSVLLLVCFILFLLINIYQTLWAPEGGYLIYVSHVYYPSNWGIY